ncbi:MAG: acyl-CoA dehydrogenase family protein [Pseudomonadota bacterium]
MQDLRPEDQAFRQEVRDFINKRFPDELRAIADSGREFSREQILTWHRILAEQGWLAPAWPAEYGGQDWPVHWPFILEEEMAQAGCPPVLPFNIKMLGPILIANGTDEQKAYWLPRILSCEDWWCQGYSEPGSGSDLASLKTRAVRDGDEYVINGSKIWTTGAHNANKMFCLVRTDPDAKPQEGISFVLIENFDDPGITVRPIHFINGRQSFNQVFFDDVRIPVSNRVGPENEGWTVAKSLLSHERLGGARAAEIRRAVERARDVATRESSGAGRLIDEDWFARRLWAVEVDLLALEQTIVRFVADAADGKTLGPETSLLKARGSATNQAARDLLADAVGYYGLPFERDAFEFDDEDGFFGPEYAIALAGDRYSIRGSTIAGGSREVQAMVTAKRVLGL